MSNRGKDPLLVRGDLDKAGHVQSQPHPVSSCFAVGLGHVLGMCW